MNLFDLYAKISIDTSEYERGVNDAGQEADSLADRLKNGLAKAADAARKSLDDTGNKAKGASGGFTVLKGAVANFAAGAAMKLVGVLGDLVSSFWNLDEATEEYRVAMGRVNTAFEAAGYGADTAQEAYRGFYGILGDTDTAAEASQLLAQLADSTEDVSVWTRIAAGVNGTFGDSLPIEGLIEAANETANVGQVTGVLADALNWVGISEDEFNQKLAACSSESERNQMIMETLSAQYEDAAEAFYENNEALVESRNNQEQLQSALSGLGEAISDVKSGVLSEFSPAISSAIESVTAFVNSIDPEEVAAVLGAVVFVFSTAWSIISGIWGAAAPLFSAVWSAIQAIFSVGSTVLSGPFSAAWSIITGVWNAAFGYFSMIWTSVAGIFSVVEAVLSGDFSGAWSAIKGVFSDWGGFFSGLWDDLTGAFSGVYSWARGLGGRIVNGIRGGISDAWSSLTGWISSKINGLWSNATSRASSSRTARSSSMSSAASAASLGEITFGTARTSSNSAGGGVTNYTQNFYSPKALTRREVRRETRNIVREVASAKW